MTTVNNVLPVRGLRFTVVDTPDDTGPRYQITLAASDAIKKKMDEKRWVDSKGRYEWSKIVTLLGDLRGIDTTRQRVKQTVENVGGHSPLLRDMLVVMELPTSLAIELDDEDRLILQAAHDGGFRELPQAEQKAFAEFVREQLALRVAAGPRKK